MSLYCELINEISKISIIDTHEHLESEGHRLAKKSDIFTVFMMHYTSSDLVSAGMTRENMLKIQDPEVELDEKWELFSPFWELAKNTAYCRAISIAINDLYGVEELTSSKYRELDQRFKSRNKRGIYEDILKNRCNIDKSILNVPAEPRNDVCDYIDRFIRLDDVDRKYFLPVINFDAFINVTNQFILKFQLFKNITVNSLKEWVLHLETALYECKTKGIIGIKTALAYDRILRYEEADFSQAEKLFLELLRTSEIETDICKLKPLQDYMMHRLLEQASALGLPVQVHTGLQDGNGNVITNANPVHMVNVFTKYPDIKFDIFHGGYPYGSELAAIAKNFPNVYVDMCWLHIISPEYSVRLLSEWLDTVPSNKIFGFGGDYVFAEGVYGHLQLAKDNIVRTLAQKVESRCMTQTFALEVAGRLLRKNPLDFFRIQENY